MANDPIDVDPWRRIIDFGLTAEDFGPRLHGLAATARSRRDLGLRFPAAVAPQPTELPIEPDPSDPLPKADVLVVTWTAAEMLALADVLTPGVNPRTRWYRYDRHFEEYVPEIRAGAPARNAMRLGSYYPTRFGSKKVLCIKSELHLNQDGVRTGAGTATLPVKRFFEQIIEEARPKVVITVGTAGSTFPDHGLGDVIITRAAKFRLTEEFANESFSDSTFTSDFRIRNKHLPKARELMQVHAARLREPDFAPPTAAYPWDGPPLPGTLNVPELKIDGRDFAKDHPMLTTDFFEFGTSTNGLEHEGCGVEMGDAVLGLVCEELGDAAPSWVVVRNASDPPINGHLPTGADGGPNMQSHWAVWYYEEYGYWTSVMSAIATWALVAP